MKKGINILVFLLLMITCGGQNLKGAITLTSANQNNTGNTYAVIVGISDYQSPQIPDLKYADRDAMAFAEWLESPAGGSVPENNIQLLLNDEAKRANISAVLDGVTEDCHENDQVIIYFSGHGDVETKSKNQLGFLLAWDSAPTNYKAGAYPLFYLQDNIQTISSKKAHVLVIMDACHAGKLAGTNIGGTIATAQSLVQQFANEVKILSCQPDEFSLEGPQWGGGRGVFSYYLIEGLTGLADKNEDKAVNLYEIDRYLEEQVPSQTSPQSQIPMVVGDKKTVLSNVNEIALNTLKVNLKNNKNQILAIDSKGFAEIFLTESDTLYNKLFKEYNTAIEKGDLLKPKGQCANDIYEILSKVEKLKPIHGLMRRNLAAALQNEPQQAINALLEGDPYEYANWNIYPEKYKEYPEYLQRAMELLGANHYSISSLKAKKLYFEAFLLKQHDNYGITTKHIEDSIRQKIKKLLYEAINLEPDAAFLYFSVARYYMDWPPQNDSVNYYGKKTLEYSPNWILPYLEIAYNYSWHQHSLEEAEKWILRAFEINPNSFIVLERLAWLKQWQDKPNEALELSRQMIHLKPQLYNGYVALSKTFWMLSEYDSTLLYSRKSMDISWESNSISDQISALFSTRKFEQALKLLDSVVIKKFIDIENKHDAIYSATRFLIDYQQYDRALKILDGYHSDSLYKGGILWLKGDTVQGSRILRNIQISSLNLCDSLVLKSWLALIAASEGKPEVADEYFKAAIHPLNGFYWDEKNEADQIYYQYGRFLLDQNRLNEAITMFEKAKEYKYHHGWKGYYGLALIDAKQGENDNALDNLEIALKNYYPIPDPIMKEPLFEKIRKTKRFKEMMEKNFGQY